MVSDIERFPPTYNNAQSPSEEGYEVVPPSRGKSPTAQGPTPDTIAEDTMNLRIADDEEPKDKSKDKDGGKSRHRGHGRRGYHHEGPGGFGRHHRQHRGFGGPPPGFCSGELRDARGPPPPGSEGYHAAFFGPPGFGHHFGPGGRGHKGDRKHKHRHARSYSPPGAGWEEYKSDAEGKGRRGKHHMSRGGPRGHGSEDFGHGRRHGHRGHGKGRDALPEDEAPGNAEQEKDLEVIDITGSTSSSSESESNSSSASESDLTPSDQERFDKFIRFHRRAFGKRHGHGKGPNGQGHPGFGGLGRFPPGAAGFGYGHFGGDRRGPPPPPACECGPASQDPPFDRRGPPQEFGFGARGFGHGHGHGRRGRPPPEFFRGEHDMRGPPAFDEGFIGHRGFGGFDRHHGHGYGGRGPRDFGFGGGRERDGFHHFGGPRAWGPDNA